MNTAWSQVEQRGQPQVYEVRVLHTLIGKCVDFMQKGLHPAASHTRYTCTIQGSIARGYAFVKSSLVCITQ